MGFWGMSNAGKEAEGYPREYGAWNFQQYKDWLANQNNFLGQGMPASQWGMEWNRNRATNGIGSPDQIWAAGRQAMPGVDEYVNNQQGRNGSIMNRWGQLTPSTETMDSVYGNTDLKRGLVDSTFDQQRDEIDNTASRAVGREGAAHGSIMDDIVGRYPKMQDAANNDYGGMRGAVAGDYATMRGKGTSTYAGLKDSADAAYTNAFTDLEQLKPTGDFAAARAARSFAPMMASTSGRLRRAGLDSSSPQAQAALQEVEAARARGMDDAQIEGQKGYVDRKVQLGLDREGTRQKLGLGELGFDTDLGREQSGIDRNLTREQSGIIRDLEREQGTLNRGEQARHSGAGNAIDDVRSTRQLSNSGQRFGQLNNWLDERSQNALLGRGLEQQDFGTWAGLTRQAGADERDAIGLRNNQFGAGLGYTVADLAERNAGAAGVENWGNNATNNAFRSGQMANNFGNTAQSAYQQAYGYEAPNAGWGVKALAGMAAPAIDMVAPGVGTMIRSGVNSANANPYSANGGAYGNPYGSASNGNNPFAALMALMQRKQNGSPLGQGGGWQDVNWNATGGGYDL